MSSVATLPSFQTHPGSHTLCNRSPSVFQTTLQSAHTTAWRNPAQVLPGFRLFAQQTRVLLGPILTLENRTLALGEPAHLKRRCENLRVWPQEEEGQGRGRGGGAVRGGRLPGGWACWAITWPRAWAKSICRLRGLICWTR